MITCAMVPTGIDLVEAFYTSMDDAHLSLKELAYVMGISQQQLHQQIHEQGHPSLLRVGLAARDPKGRAFLQAFMPRYLDAIGMHEMAETLRRGAALNALMQRIQVVVLDSDLFAGRREMVKAQIRRESAERQRA